MRKHAQEDEEDTEINMTPMLDIVFIMLIFFIVTATFIKDAGVDVRKPTADTAEKKDKAAILIAVTDTDEVWINRGEVEVDAVRSEVEKLHAENPRGTVVVQADTAAKAKLVLDVIEAARAAGVPNVALSAET
ncbi:biopolymer transporter ExbD [Rhodothalassium salexigens]|uniref:Outer membrane transport energization protein ExbD n=1 Tax=Rhodothalassium salexigens DSM 2132 TaxID=1188247 RepID=A0A4V6NQV8_RHOSA|nr:biopolymer transporter ExbD [Rhodothalassium salexigens]MBB4210976.1 biopolymer transport protein ExbD [Rhodothalassium salexigens DSM 2132]MBK1638707.1 biopolymer transporter ExbD [Rhodothalassium salexigens DSM 2132]MBK5910041.1 biopolymer transporter ExbD [Rhodothalassium salexigens]MBK5921550.1 biopolymer transporter ExbD [Rhodothalassium salexigens]TCP36366.1 outer membrane transport energization protein ExbD [Rhodothalassium salexigens DSM 2132]